MMAPPVQRKRLFDDKRSLVFLALAVGAILLIVANVHLVQVAVTSQPDCVPHLKSADGEGAYRAARSAC
jgi:hypothetical protein